jgi:hypothetical protein
MNDEEKLDRIEEYVTRILEVLAEHFPESLNDTAAFTCALSKVLGIWIADIAGEDNRPVGSLVKIANGVVKDVARNCEADRRGRLQ